MLTKQAILQVIKSQEESLRMNPKGVERQALKKIKLAPSFAFIISGIRRCGKSTLLHQLYDRHKIRYYLNLEDPRLAGFDLQDFAKAEDAFKEIYGDSGIYFFDEIQNISEWEKYIRGLADRGNKIVIIGSNASLLSRELGTKLTGRNLRLELFPFSYQEFLAFTNMEASLDSYSQYLSKGGFPEYLALKNEEVLQRLLNDIVMRDVVFRHSIKNDMLVKKMAIFLISNSGKAFSFNSLRKIFEVSAIQTVIDYVSFLEDSYMIFTIPLFSYSLKKQQVNPKKAYSIDTGFSSANSSAFSEGKGRILENQVFLALRQNHPDIFYFRNKKECDFLVKEKNRIISAIQVCLSVNDDNIKREIDGLTEAIDELKLKEGLILTLDQEDKFEVEGKKIIVKPVWKWLLEEGK
jgi:predicted AAA+ superfamily ATPase